MKVKGTIDSYAFNQYKLMPMGNGRLFLPVKAEIRKKINKKEGDLVHVILYSDESPIVVPDEIIECFRNEPKEIFETFLSYTEGNQKSLSRLDK